MRKVLGKTGSRRIRKVALAVAMALGVAWQADAAPPTTPAADYRIVGYVGDHQPLPHVSADKLDVIFAPSGLELTDDVFERADMISVLAIETPVMALDDVLVTKLMALDEHSVDYGSLLGIARACREQIDW